MRKILAIGLAWLALLGGALAQGSNVGPLPAWGVAGNPTASTAPPAQADLSTLFDGKFCSTSGSFMERGASAWNCQTQLQTQALLFINSLPGGRLTLQSATPVMTSTQSAQTTVYYAPYNSPYVPIYNGTQVGLYQFTASNSDTVGLSMALGSNWAANSVYDVFVTVVFNEVGLCTIPWTNTTTRATALANFAGILTNSASATCRTTNSVTLTLPQNQGTYLGSFYTNGSTGTVDYIFGGSASGGTAASFGVFNYYNRVDVMTNVIDSGTTYTYTTATIRQARASAGNQVKFIVGVVEDGIFAAVSGGIQPTANIGAFGQIGVGCNSTSTFTGQPAQATDATAAVNPLSMGVTVFCAPSLGIYTVSHNENGDGTHATTFDNSSLDTLTVRFRM